VDETGWISASEEGAHKGHPYEIDGVGRPWHRIS